MTWILIVFFLASHDRQTIEKVYDIKTEAECQKVGAEMLKSWKTKDTRVSFACVESTK